jgi:hypothetical protein
MPPLPSVSYEEKNFVKASKDYENGGYFYEFPKEVRVTNKPVFIKNINGYFFPATEDVIDDDYYYDKDGNFLLSSRGTYYGYYEPTKTNYDYSSTNLGKKITPDQRREIISRSINEQQRIMQEQNDRENKQIQIEENYKLQQKQEQEQIEKEKQEEDKKHGWWGYNKDHSMWGEADGGKSRKRRINKRKTHKRKTHKRKTYKRKANKNRK